MKKINELLKGFKVPINLYLLERAEGLKEVMLTGGLEVIHRVKLEDSNKLLQDSKSSLDTLTKLSYKDIPPFMYVEDVQYKVKDLEVLLKYKSKKQLSKAEFMEFGDSAESSALSVLENKIVYIHEQKPSTNSLSLAKQFGLKHRTVIQDLFSIAENNPSVLTGIEFKGYVYKTKTATNYATYLEVSEDAYYLFLENMGTAKSPEMRALRATKRREYFSGFQRLRELSYSLGFKENDMVKLIGIRTDKTKLLMSHLRSYYIKVNDNSGSNKQINPIALYRVVFNVINRHLGLDAILHQGVKKDRGALDSTTQQELLLIENSIIAFLTHFEEIPSNLDGTKEHIIDILSKVCSCPVDRIYEYLKEYEVYDLLEQL